MSRELDGNVVFDFGAGEEMTLLGVAAADLHAQDFLLRRGPGPGRVVGSAGARG